MLGGKGKPLKQVVQNTNSVKFLLFHRKVCVCVFRKKRQLVFTRSSGRSSERTGGPTGTDFQLNDRPLSDREVTSPLKLQWYEYPTLTPFR